MITQLFKSKPTQRKHLDAPLLQVRIRFLSMKSEQGLCQEHLKKLGTYSSGVCFLLQSSRWKHYTNLIKRSRKQSGVMGKINFQKIP